MSDSIDSRLREWVSSLLPGSPLKTETVRSNEANQVFRFFYRHRTVYLKIGSDLKNENRNLRWSIGRLPCPEVLGFLSFDKGDALLMSAVAGKDLAELTTTLSPHEIIQRLTKALQLLHSTDVSDWPFGEINESSVLVHGDACLPNFIYSDTNFGGYIDVGEMGIRSSCVDLSAAIWSLQRNLGPGYGLAFLREYGLAKATESDVERLRLMYKNSQPDH